MAIFRPVNDTTTQQQRPDASGGAGAPGPSFQHQLWIADGELGFGEAVASMMASPDVAAVVVVAPAARHDELRAALPSGALEPRFVDVDVAARNPARLITIWLDAVAEAAADADGGRLLGISESVHSGRTTDELAEAQQVDRLLSLAIPEASNLLLTCVYDGAALPAAELERVWDEQAAATGADGAPLLHDASLLASLEPAPLGEVPQQARRIEIDEMAGLAEVRRAVLEETTAAGLSDARADDVALAANELAANSVRHGGGRGTLLVWRTADAVVVQSEDAGHITDPLAGMRRPEPMRSSGRGLWMVNQISDLVQRRNTSGGLATRATFLLPLAAEASM